MGCIKYLQPNGIPFLKIHTPLFSEIICPASIIKNHASVILQHLIEAKDRKLLPSLLLQQLQYLKLSHEKISDILYNADALRSIVVCTKPFSKR